MLWAIAAPYVSTITSQMAFAPAALALASFAVALVVAGAVAGGDAVGTAVAAAITAAPLALLGKWQLERQLLDLFHR